MALKSLAFTKAEQKERNSSKPCMEYSGEKYPWGMRLDFNGDVMKKLGMPSLPKTGKEVMITAKAKVVSTSINDREGGKPEQRMELQITAIEVTGGGGSLEDAIDDALEEADEDE
jgi:hypothetical protein